MRGRRSLITRARILSCMDITLQRLLKAPPVPRWFAPVLITLAVGITACSGGDTTPVPAPPVEDVLGQSRQRMAALTSFRFDLRNEGGVTPIGGTGLELRSTTGVMVRPDRLDTQMLTQFSGFLVQVHVISIGDVTYMTNPIGRGWQVFGSGVSPVAFFDPANGVSLILNSVMEPSILEETDVGGTPSYRIRGRIPAESVQFIAGGFVEDTILDAELFIGIEDSLLRRVFLDGRTSDEEPEGINRTLSFSDFNGSFTIVPPV